MGSKIINALPVDLEEEQNVQIFHSKLKLYLIYKCTYEVQGLYE